MTADMLRILQVSTSDRGGGAEAVARNLHQAFRARHLEATLVVGQRLGVDEGVARLNNAVRQNAWSRLWWRLDDQVTERPARQAAIWHKVFRALADPARVIELQAGAENVRFPGTWHILDTLPTRPDVLHAHNLHGHYFDLRSLPWLSRQVPTLLTLHDTWLLSGHCAYSIECDRWLSGCGHCPDLKRYPAVRRDATGTNWTKKKLLYEKSTFYIAAPSQWLLDRVARSIFAPAVRQARIIPYGIDLAIFRPGDQMTARQRLGLPAEARVLLFVAVKGQNNPYKDYGTIEAATAKLSCDWPGVPLVVVALGAAGVTRRIGNSELLYVPFQSDPRVVATYYQAADVYVHAAKADTFPNVVLEAMACGAPVVATAVGGIPEQVVEGETGFLTPPGDVDAMAAALARVLSDDPLRAVLARQTAARARRCYDLVRQSDDYLDYYHWALADFAERRDVPANA